MENENRPKRTLEPGTLDKTRKNIGPIDANEALFMQKKLGGEVLREKLSPADYSNMPANRKRQVRGQKYPLYMFFRHPNGHLG